jgi:hypothetical protein
VKSACWHHRTRMECSDDDFFPIPAFRHTLSGYRWGVQR